MKTNHDYTLHLINKYISEMPTLLRDFTVSNFVPDDFINMETKHSVISGIAFLFATEYTWSQQMHPCDYSDLELKILLECFNHFVSIEPDLIKYLETKPDIRGQFLIQEYNKTVLN